jgi:hypothetical protein
LLSGPWEKEELKESEMNTTHSANQRERKGKFEIAVQFKGPEKTNASEFSMRGKFSKVPQRKSLFCRIQFD